MSDRSTETAPLVDRLWESDAASALTNEAAREIERLRVALNHIAENVCRQPKEATKLFALRELS